MYNCECGDNILNNNNLSILNHNYSIQHKINLLNKKIFNYSNKNNIIYITDIELQKMCKICEICYNNNINIKFNCGHSLCESCYKSILKHNLLTCPYCRETIFINENIYEGDIIILERNNFLCSYQVIEITETEIILLSINDKITYRFHKLELYHYTIYKLLKSWIDYNNFLKYITDLHYIYHNIYNIENSYISSEYFNEKNNFSDLIKCIHFGFIQLQEILLEKFNIQLNINNSIIIKYGIYIDKNESIINNPCNNYDDSDDSDDYNNSDISLDNSSLYYISNITNNYIELSSIYKVHKISFKNFIEYFTHNNLIIYNTTKFKEYISLSTYDLILYMINHNKHHLIKLWQI